MTGATSGLGWRFARVLASVGTKVVVSGRRVERLEELAELVRADGGEALPLRLDMMSSESIARSSNRPKRRWPR